mgnify:CR=1 FL=1
MTNTSSINYKQIVADLASIAYKHPQIQSFGFGDLSECTNDIVTKQEPRYTRMYVVPGEVRLNENHLHYKDEYTHQARYDHNALFADLLANPHQEQCSTSHCEHHADVEKKRESKELHIDKLWYNNPWCCAVRF